jgi:hypothetical protein
MSKLVRARRLVALIAAYVVALQTLLLPLSVAAGSPFQASLCNEASGGAPVQHDAGCPCAAGCGMQCCVQSLLGPPQNGVTFQQTGATVVALPVTFDSIVRIAHRSPHSPRAPPVG